MKWKERVKQYCININNERYEKELHTRRGDYREWVEELERGWAEEIHTAEAEDPTAPETFRKAAERFVLIRNPKGRPAAHAAEWIGRYATEFPKAMVLYGNEDVWPEGGERRSPHFTHDWSPDLFDTQFYPGGLVAVRRDLLDGHEEELKPLLGQLEELQKDARESDEAFRAYGDVCRRLVRRAVLWAGGYERGKGRETIRHLPRVLWHNADEDTQEAWMQYGAEADGTGAGDGSSGTRSAEVGGTGVGDVSSAAQPEEARLLSIVIPSKDNPDLLVTCIQSILRLETALRYEIIVVDNGSAPEEKARIQAFLRGLQSAGTPGLSRIVYDYEPGDFNFSRMCNLGAAEANGNILLFLNDDVELAVRDSLKNMTELAVRPYTGAVGLKLLYPDVRELKQIQHVGITQVSVGPVHKLQFCRDDRPYYFGRNRGRQNVWAVTGACLMVERGKFEEVGGFAEELPVAFNDVDLCMRLWEQGYENVCQCDGFAWHDESYSRGLDDSPEKRERLLRERRKLYERHPGCEGRPDPYYSVYLNRDGVDMQIRPVYKTCKNRAQQIETGDLAPVRPRELALFREDACLMACLESAESTENGEGRILSGWSVILGDNNACYDKRIVFWRCDGKGEPDPDIPCRAFPLRGQYRPDLLENMPDQVNVGLCGYRVELAGGVLEPGEYRIGILARNRVTGTRLLNRVERTVTM
ncbi:MAG: glycosyltransferase [Clostridium sp.]|nr:glycosyltransferase [Acetatifactor muris]MCM1525932.1 glycosyltransferase [Bacteroides sp.]MCM1562529.1 glycosyltransferase [Clostridium sp.]